MNNYKTRDIRRELKEAEAHLESLMLERWEVYNRLRDFDTPYAVSEKLKKRLTGHEGTVGLNSSIKSAQRRVNELKGELGWTDNQIKATETFTATNPNSSRTADTEG